ncbi:hypothetical protein NQL31_006543 [Lotmaria passim]
MSANINFATSSAATAASGSSASPSAVTRKAANAFASPPSAETKAKSHMILPYEVLFNLVGRRVTVLLTRKGTELEGMLQSVDSDKGDMFLSDVVRYNWRPAAATSADGAEAGERKGAEHTNKLEDGYQASFGGGHRKEVSRCKQAMVNSNYVALVTPTLFIPQ